MPPRAVVTGAFSYTGSAVVRALRQRGWRVHTLTNRTRPPGTEDITAAPLRFDADHLVRELRGADAFVNTYWIRLPRGGQDFGTAVRNCRCLLDAATLAGVGRFVHLSVSNASSAAGLGYYRGKGEVEEAIRAAGHPYAIVRPTLVVGPRDVLTSNIAWCLRRFPVFPVPGHGRYRLQPVTLDDVGRIVADAVACDEDLEVDAAGPDIVTFREYVALVARACGLRRRVVASPRWLSLAALRVLGLLLGDVVLTPEELAGLEQERLVSRRPPLGRQSVPRWIEMHGNALGRRYVNDVRRHFGRGASEPILAP